MLFQKKKKPLVYICIFNLLGLQSRRTTDRAPHMLDSDACVNRPSSGLEPGFTHCEFFIKENLTLKK